jgi:hypothetical protein
MLAHLSGRLGYLWLNIGTIVAFTRQLAILLLRLSMAIHPKHFGLSEDDAIQNADLSIWLKDRHLMTDLVKQHLGRAKERMKKQANKNRSERKFKVGDMVFLKLQPYVQSSLAHRSNLKLSFKFFGPFKVLARVGYVAYKLELPSTAAIHPVFHVS